MSSELNQTSAYDKVQLARHPKRPYTMDVIDKVFTEFTELAGDRRYGDDAAIVTGFARFAARPVLVVGHQKGRDTQERKLRNFGMPKPEGYRKALRAMKLAEKFGRPVITFVDTMGAYPGIEAEERGQAEAIAFNLYEMAHLRVPIITVILGEGGSGGALGIGVCDKLLMLENAVYSVISPEGCAAILWKSHEFTERASECLKLTADDLLGLGIVDMIVKEPSGGAHSDVEEQYKIIAATLEVTLTSVGQMETERLLVERYKKFNNIGKWV